MERQRFGVGTHTDLDDVNANVTDAGVDLFGNEGGWDVMNFIHGLGALGRQCRRRCHCVALMHSDNSLVGFKATDWRSNICIIEQQEEED